MSRTRAAVLAALLMASLAALAISILSRSDGAVDEPTDVGDTLDLAPGAWWAVEWKDDDTVTFQEAMAVTTVRLDGTVVGSTPNDFPPPNSDPRGIKLENLARFGSWKAWDGGHYLVRDDEKCGPPLVPSPDGRFVACQHVVFDRLSETSESSGAVIRIR